MEFLQGDTVILLSEYDGPAIHDYGAPHARITIDAYERAVVIRSDNMVGIVTVKSGPWIFDMYTENLALIDRLEHPAVETVREKIRNAPSGCTVELTREECEASGLDDLLQHSFQVGDIVRSSALAKDYLPFDPGEGTVAETNESGMIAVQFPSGTAYCSANALELVRRPEKSPTSDENELWVIHRYLDEKRVPAGPLLARISGLIGRYDGELDGLWRDNDRLRQELDLYRGPCIDGCCECRMAT